MVETKIFCDTCGKKITTKPNTFGMHIGQDEKLYIEIKECEYLLEKEKFSHHFCSAECILLWLMSWFQINNLSLENENNEKNNS